MIGIYKIISPSKRIYIGQSIDIEKRKQDYKYNKCQGQIRLLKSINKYGWLAHNFIILEECPLTLLNERERYWQDYYNVLSYKGLNCKLTKSADKSGELCSITKSKIKNALLGKKHSEQRKINQSKAQKGKKRSQSHKENLKQAAIKRCNGNVDFLLKNIRKPIEQYLNNILIQTYPSAREAQRQTGIDISSITNCCNGKKYYKSAGGFVWKYKTIEEAFKLI